MHINPFTPRPEQKHTPEEVAAILKKQKELMRDDLNYVEDCKAALMDEKLSWANGILYLLCAFIVGFLIWSGLTKIDIRTKGMGQVISSKSEQLIASLEGGIISEILVSVGDVVQKGDVLVRINDTIFNASYKENQAKYYTLTAKIARLNAEIEGKDTVQFPPEVSQRYPDIVKTEMELFHKDRINIKNIMEHIQQNLELAQEELKIKEPLATEGIISQVELLAVKRNVVTLAGQLEDAKSNYIKEASTQLAQAKEDLQSLEESIRGYEDRVLRATIRSPVHGTVKNILVNTVGGVVRPGENIMQIVPLDDTLIIKAKISPKDIGFIHPGQKAIVKFTAYDYAIYGGLDGVVETISADTITDTRPDGKGESSYYEVRIRTFKNYLGPEWAPLPIIPGMVADVSIITGKRTILGYIIKPLIRGQNAFSER